MSRTVNKGFVYAFFGRRNLGRDKFYLFLSEQQNKKNIDPEWLLEDVILAPLLQNIIY